MISLYMALLLTGFVLITLEVFIPGGVVGAIGAVALVAAAGVGLVAFDGAMGLLAAFGAIFFTVGAIILWLKYFPKSRMGKALTVSTDLQAAQSAPSELASLLGATGETVSALRPAGFAVFDGRRVDVVTRGGMIAAGQPVRVILVEGTRVVVENVSDSGSWPTT